MKEVIAIIRPEKWQATQKATAALGIREIAHQRVLGRGRQRGLRYLRPISGEEEGGLLYLPKRMVVWLIPDEQVDLLIGAVTRVNQAGNYGDGKLFICPVDSLSDVGVDEIVEQAARVVIPQQKAAE